MLKLKLTIGLIAFFIGCNAFAEEMPAAPLTQSAPLYPDSCLIALPDDVGKQRVAVTFDVTKEGLPEKVRVRESSHPCFDDAAVAAVRRWTFEPRRSNGKKTAQTDLEAIFIFELDSETQTNTIDARPKKRVPPRYPDRCQESAGGEEIVTVLFDVTEKGETVNIRVQDTTNSCFNREATRSVKKWEYVPMVVDGKPARRNNVVTTIAFRLAGDKPSPEEQIRPKLFRELNKAGRFIQSDPERALEMVAAIEAEYGDTFTAAESAAFHQIRGYARIGVGDAFGALDDLRIAKGRSKSQETAEALDVTISMLEEAIENAAEQPAPGTDETPPEEEPPAE